MEKSQSSMKITVAIVGNQKTEKVSATVKLYVKENGNYKNVKTWKNLSSSGQKLYITKSCSTKGTEYKLAVNGTLSDGKNAVTFNKNIVRKIQ